VAPGWGSRERVFMQNMREVQVLRWSS